MNKEELFRAKTLSQGKGKTIGEWSINGRLPIDELLVYTEKQKASDKEEAMINGIIENIRNEYNANIDKFNQDVIIAQLELLFTYAQRFYERQFITEK